jgi:hypothetical protein
MSDEPCSVCGSPYHSADEMHPSPSPSRDPSTRMVSFRTLEKAEQVAMELGRESGRDDERADVVAWLRSVGVFKGVCDAVERGEHVDAARAKGAAK